MCSVSCDVVKFREISDNISETVPDRDMVALAHNNISCVAYWMASLSVTLN